MDYKHSVVIGRFQPFHNSHLELIKHGLSISEQVLIVIGSANSAPTIKNPWSFEEREIMIRSCFNSQNNAKIQCIPVRDYYYNDNYWITDIQAKTSQYIQHGDSVALLGNFKDSSSYYLKYFPQWDFTPVKTKSNLNATDIRKIMFNEKFDDLYDIENFLPTPVLKWIRDNYFIMDQGWTDKPSPYLNLVKEFKYIEGYRKLWEKAPFPPTFITADCVVICSGHVLVVKRATNPGKDLLALPGGFIKQSERIKDAALRELKEETGIRVDKIILESSIKDSHVFDHPERSLRGRTITHAYCIRLKDGELPEVKGNDDASKAFWLPIMDINKLEHEFFEDHSSIINYFISRN